MSTSINTATELVRDYYASWSKGIESFDEARLRAVLASDLRFEGPIAGTRTGMEPFLRDIDKLFGKAYDGARHASGDSDAWGEKRIRHYEAIRIDPTAKAAVFSDSLDIPGAVKLANHFHGRIRTTFGIGISLINDMGFEPLSIVIKMTRCNGRPAAKLSDSPGKTMCYDAVYLDYLRLVFEMQPVS